MATDVTDDGDTDVESGAFEVYHVVDALLEAHGTPETVSSDDDVHEPGDAVPHYLIPPHDTRHQRASKLCPARASHAQPARYTASRHAVEVTDRIVKWLQITTGVLGIIILGVTAARYVSVLYFSWFH